MNDQDQICINVIGSTGFRFYATEAEANKIHAELIRRGTVGAKTTMSSFSIEVTTAEKFFANDDAIIV